MEPAKLESNIQGEPLDLADLMDFAVIDPADLAGAALWWENHASPAWKGALDG